MDFSPLSVYHKAERGEFMYHSRKQARRKRSLRRGVLLAALLLLVSLGVLLRMEPEVQTAAVTLYYHGNAYTVPSQGDTVQALLKRLGLALSEADRLSLPLDAQLEPGMVLHVDEILEGEETFCLVLPAQTVYTQDISLPLGAEKLLTPGQDGELKCTALVKYINGIEASRSYLSQEILTESRDRVVALGTRTDSGEAPVIGRNFIQLPDGQLMTYTGTASLSASAYTHTDLFRSKLTALGTQVHRGTIAVDPAKIPLGTRLFIVTDDGSWVYGIARAEDNLAGTEGTDLELYFPTVRECMDFGTRMCTVYFLG